MSISLLLIKYCEFKLIFQLAADNLVSSLLTFKDGRLDHLIRVPGTGSISVMK